MRNRRLVGHQPAVDGLSETRCNGWSTGVTTRRVSRWSTGSASSRYVGVPASWPTWRARFAETDPAALTGSTGLGHTRWATHGRPHRPQRAPAPRRGGQDRRRPQRHHRELRDAAPRTGGCRRRIRQRHRHRGGRPPGRPGIPPRRDRGRLHRLRAARCCAASRATSPWCSPTPTNRAPSWRRAAPRRWWSASARARCSWLRRRRLYRTHPQRRRARPGSGRGDHRRRLSDHRLLRQRRHQECPEVHRLGPGRRRKGRLQYFMLKEIEEQPAAVADTLLGHFVDGQIVLDEQRLLWQELREIDKVFVVACGPRITLGCSPSWRSNTGPGSRSRSRWRASSVIATRCSTAARWSSRSPSPGRPPTRGSRATCPGAARPGPGDLQHQRSPDSPRVRRRVLHQRQPGDRGRVDEDVRGPGRRRLTGRARAGSGPRHQIRRRDGPRIPRAGRHTRADGPHARAIDPVRRSPARSPRQRPSCSSAATSAIR